MGGSPLCNTLCKDLDRKIMKVTNELVKRVGTLLSVTHNEGTKPMNTAVVKKGGGTLISYLQPCQADYVVGELQTDMVTCISGKDRKTMNANQ